MQIVRAIADSEAAVEDEIHLIDSLCTTRAFENNIVFAYCNAAGDLKTDNLDYVLSGRSQITHPLDKVLCKSTSNQEEIILSMVSIDENLPNGATSTTASG